jgi:hypothetical protein
MFVLNYNTYYTAKTLQEDKENKLVTSCGSFILGSTLADLIISRSFSKICLWMLHLRHRWLTVLSLQLHSISQVRVMSEKKRRTSKSCGRMFTQTDRQTKG